MVHPELIVGLDLSLTGTGVADSDGTRTIKSNAKIAIEPRLNAILGEVKSYTGDNADLVIIEGLAFASQTGKVAERGALHFMVRVYLWEVGIPFAICPPTVLKKYLTGKGNASKDEMMFAGARAFTWVEKTLNNNENDALAMYAMAMERIGQPIIDVPKVNRDALAKVEWPEGI